MVQFQGNIICGLQHEAPFSSAQHNLVLCTQQVRMLLFYVRNSTLMTLNSIQIHAR